MRPNFSPIRKTFIFLFLFLIQLAFIPSALAKPSFLEVETTDTIAGYSALLKVGDTLPQTEIEILVTKPNGSQVLTIEKTDSEGNLKVDLYDYHTKKAGIYQTKARFANQNEDYGPINTFRVYPDSVSPSRSLIKVNKEIAEATGYDYVELTVQLLDQYGNPIKGHTVELISSRTSDQIVQTSSYPYTDEKGEVTYFVYSEQMGVSTFLALDTTAKVTLNLRAEIAFFNPREYSKEIGGDTKVFLASANSTSESGPVAYFKIEDLREEVEVGESLTFTVTAYDEEENVAQNYTGTIHFSSSDDQAELPFDYTFRAEDQGIHTFSLSLNFLTPGVQILEATDLDNFEIKGETEVTVLSKEGTGASTTTENTTAAEGEITLETPLPGSYSSDEVLVSGQATYGWKIYVYDHNRKIGETSVKSDNSFSYSASNLSEGEHIFYVEAVDSEEGVQAVSEEVEIEINTTPPSLDSVIIEPSGTVQPNGVFEITIYSEPNLAQAAIVFNNQIAELTEDLDNLGKYDTSLVAPGEEGSYSLDVILVDQLGNEISYSDQTVITIKTGEGETGLAKEQEETTIGYPSKVTGVEANPGDSRVTLTWEAATDDTYIAHYRVYYGPYEDTLESYADTFDSSTTWYIPNLINGETYYFAVTAIDSAGYESLEKSGVKSGTPVAPQEETEVTLHQAAEEIEELPETEETPESGPEIAWIITGAVLSLEIYLRFRKKTNPVF